MNKFISENLDFCNKLHEVAQTDNMISQKEIVYFFDDQNPGMC